MRRRRNAFSAFSACTSAAPPPATMPSAMAARQADSASSTRCCSSFSSAFVGAPTRMTAILPVPVLEWAATIGLGLRLLPILHEECRTVLKMTAQRTGSAPALRSERWRKKRDQVVRGIVLSCATAARRCARRWARRSPHAAAWVPSLWQTDARMTDVRDDRRPGIFALVILTVAILK